jgi:hypothetical protein
LSRVGLREDGDAADAGVGQFQETRSGDGGGLALDESNVGDKPVAGEAGIGAVGGRVGDFEDVDELGRGDLDCRATRFDARGLVAGVDGSAVLTALARGKSGPDGFAASGAVERIERAVVVHTQPGVAWAEVTNEKVFAVVDDLRPGYVDDHGGRGDAAFAAVDPLVTDMERKILRLAESTRQRKQDEDRAE